jgi:hypothetical protein
MGSSLKMSRPSLTCANKEHRISDIPLEENDEKLSWTLLSNSMFEINFRPRNKRTTVCPYLLPYHPSVHLQETLSSYQRTIRKRPSSWNIKWNADRKGEKVADLCGTTVIDMTNIHPFSGSILEQMHTRNTSPTSYITLISVLDLYSFIQEHFLRMAHRCRNIRRFIVFMEFVLWIVSY